MKPLRINPRRAHLTLLAATLTILSSSAALCAQQSSVIRLDGSKISPQQIDATVARLMKSAHVTGAGIAIFNGGKLAFIKAYGYRDAEKHWRLTPDSVMTAASLTKSTFATMVMQLVQEHVIDLDKPVYQYLPKPLPEYSAYADLAPDPRYKLITMRMLLSHTSGFPNWRRFMDDKKLSINFTPGSRFAYSGEGIALAQMIVEAVMNKSVNDLLDAHIFHPLGMTRSSLVWEKRFETDYANGYGQMGKSLGPERRSRPDVAGSMQTTLRDLARFVGAVLNGEVLDPPTRKMMLSPQVQILSKHEFPSLSPETTTENQSIHLSYGLGWGLYWSPYGEAFFKEGHDDLGWRHYVVCFDKPKSGILIMTNSNNGEDIYSGVLEDLLRDTFTPLEWEGFKPSADVDSARL